MDINELPKEKPLGRGEDLRNQKFGMLTALYRTEDTIYGGQNKTTWLCQCECGEYVLATMNALKTGGCASCGNHKPKDITGKKFGHLTAKYLTEFRTENNGGAVWYLECDCGWYVYSSLHSLNIGDRKQCNYHYERSLIGKRFGHLTVKEYIGTKVDKQGKNRTYFLCGCDCGNDTEVCVTQLLNGNTKSCGHHNIRDIAGMEFGQLTALHVDYSKWIPNSGMPVPWICECQCGNVASVNEGALVSGNTQTCGHQTTSLGEQEITRILTENHKPFIPQMQFDTCRFPETNRLAKFDFYVVVADPFLLEFDGTQHEKPNGKFTQEDYEIIHKRDVYKNNWCLENELPIKRIPYKYKGSITIEDILSDKFLITPETHPEWYK